MLNSPQFIYSRYGTASQTVFSITQFDYFCLTIIHMITEAGIKDYSSDMSTVEIEIE